MAVKKNKCNCGHRLYPENNGQIYDCDGCKTKGVGLTYRCGACEFDLHPECMNSPATISPEICEGHHLKFFKRPPPRANQKPRKAKNFVLSICRACGMRVEGFSYHCKETDTYLHPRCALLKSEIPVLAPPPTAAAADDDDYPAVKLVLKKESKYCDVCQSAEHSGVDEKIPGWCYSCIDDDGGEYASYHVYCLMKLLIKERAHAMMKGGGGGCGSTGAKNFNNGNKMVECLEITKEPIRADIPSKYTKEKKPGRGGRTKFVLQICRTILAAVVSILVGDPTALLANAMVEAVIPLLTTN